jgi:Arc/MetJ-type ribon-helix-helix transcriptional regulator
MSEQIAIRIPSELAKQLDEMVARGRFETKAEAVRSAIRSMVEADRRREIGQRIIDGYRRVPQTDDEVSAATEAAVRSIHEEPW